MGTSIEIPPARIDAWRKKLKQAKEFYRSPNLFNHFEGRKPKFKNIRELTEQEVESLKGKPSHAKQA